MSVSFQTAPAHAVDDLLVTADAAVEPIEVAIACRATPNFVPSDTATVSLIKAILTDLDAHENPTNTVVIAVAGWKEQWNQVAQLCSIARTHGTAADFNKVLSQDNTWGRPIRDRHRYLCDMVTLATGSTPSSPATEAVRAKTWWMLSRLRVVGFDVQEPRDAEWTGTASLLDSVASESASGIALRDALASRAATYDAIGAKSVTVQAVRRDMRGIVDPSVGRTQHVWDALAEQRRAALASVRHTLGTDSSDSAPLQLEFGERRKQLSEKVLLAAEAAGAVVVAGESGTGKSALTLSTILGLESNPANCLEAVILNMRELPRDSLSLHAALGANLIDVLGQIDAPRRLLVIDGADIAAERPSGLLRDLLSAASTASVAAVVVSADVALDFVTEQVQTFHTDSADRYAVDPLNDDDLAQVSTHVPALTGMLREVPKASLLRRLVVLDLLSRTGLTLDHPMREWECLELIWTNVVRGDGRPISGSAEARDRTLVLLAKAALEGSEAVDGLDAESIDALRADRLLAPHSSFHHLPQFAHDEVRRYATAMHLVRRSDIPNAVASAGTPRWALSAATLACKGRLSDPSAAPATVFTSMVGGFRDVALSSGARWADVPIEAVFDTDSAYACLRVTVRKEPANLELKDVIRVVQQRLAVDGFIGRAADPAILLLLDDPTPWRISSAAFKLLTTWLRTTTLVCYPAGHDLRVRLRERLLDFWNLCPPQPPSDENEIDSLFEGRSRRPRVLDHRLTDSEYVESLAMLGKDINADIETCLRAIADDAPAYLAPAADSPFSARSLVQYNPEFLAELMEAYYIDDSLEGDCPHSDEGIREHDSSWSGISPPFNAHYFGSFWTLFQVAHLDTSVRVLNNILNHAAMARVQVTTGLHQSPLEHGLREDDELTGADLALDGTTRNYVGDGGTWFWYRGTSVGPYPCMSALQAMERVLEPVFQVDDAVQPLVDKLLAGCENLAVPGLLCGLLVRNIEHAGTSLDPFLAEPEVWELEFSRCVSEHYSFKADSEWLAHPERRTWTPREACITLVTCGNEDRRAALQAVGGLLKENGDRLGRDSLVVQQWAAHLDIERFRLERNKDQTYLFVQPPEESVAASAPQVAQQEHVAATLSIQNKYTRGIDDHDYVPPPAAETADDLVAVRHLLETSTEGTHIEPHTAVTLVVRNAIQHAADGAPEALGNESSFAVRSVLQTAALLSQTPDQSNEGQYYEIGADRSAASALPLLLSDSLARPLTEAGATRDQVIELGHTIATRASTEPRLFLARACDLIWASPCYGTPCSHAVALDWAIDAGRGAEIGTRNNDEQQYERTRIAGDLLARLQQVPNDSIHIAALDTTIRSTGAAAVHNHCTTNAAQKLLAGLLDIQPRAMVSHGKRRWTTDDRGSHTLIAARALLTGYSTNQDPNPILAYLDALRPDAGLISNFLHGLAGSGAETQTRAEAATHLWPTLLDHALTYATPSETNIYNQRTWGSWAAAALLPQPAVWSQGLHHELQGTPIDWVDPTNLTPLIDAWIQTSPAEMKVVDALLGFIARLTEAEQITRGIPWVTRTCIKDGIVLVKESYELASWLKQTHLPAELNGHGEAWQRLVDALVVAGNTELAPFSR
ncbi:NACHT domain-containing protein [Corynebacterium sp.]|uniref:NACHT domain-containing protein n=1 Tax=Corynebacterium sp. TaxID=1720 RepID=UPI003B3B6D3A